MKKMSKPIVFFGSGPVAAESLRLLAQNFEIEAIVTKPTTSKEMAAALKDGRVYSVSNKLELDELIASKPFQSELGVLVDFGILVSQEIIDYFPLGIVNSHFSILPEWRGADPITFAVLSGQRETGVSLMLLVEAMDEGPLLAYGKYNIANDTTTPQLTDGLIQLSNALLTELLPGYAAGEVVLAQQDVTGRHASYSRKITKDDGLIDWSKSAEILERQIRAFAGWPKSRTQLGGKEVIITKSHVVPGNSTSSKPGDIDLSSLDNGVLMIETADGKLCIDALKPAGKQEMTGKAFLAGYKKFLLT